nr:hypothetical protein Ccrd_010332 [Tanacetum cinerariifolium]
MALTGRLSNTSYMGFQYSVENVVDHLTTNGITAIPEEVTATGWGEEFSDDEVTQEEFSDDEVTREEFSDDEATQEEFSDDEVTREEFSDDEVTSGKVTILNEAEEESDWDDDERSGEKNLAIQERHAQNQQDFLDKYLPEWNNL